MPDSAAGQRVRVAWHAAGAAVVAAMVWFPLHNSDIWWHLAAGREVLAAGWLFFDPFSTSAFGEPWRNVHWLFQVGAASVFQLAGIPGLVVAKVACVVAAWIVLVHSAEAGGAKTPIVVVLSLLGLFGARHLVLARPIVASLLLLSAFFAILEGYRREGRWQRLLWLMPLQVLWANTQGLHAMGPVMIAVWGVGRSIDSMRGPTVGGWAVSPARVGRALGASFVGALAVSLINPYGLGAALLPWRLFGRIEPETANLYATAVSENVPPHLLAQSGQFLWHLPVAIAAATAIVMFARRRISAAHVGLLLASFALALMANRNLLLAYWLVPTVVALNVPGAWGRWAVARPMPAAIALGALAVVAGTLMAREPSIADAGPFQTPEPVASTLLGLPPGDVFASVRYGSYLTWRTAPDHRPYYDGRLILRTRASFAEYLDAVDRPEAFLLLAAREGFRYALLPVAAPDRYQGLIRALHRRAGWRLLATDGTAVLFGWDLPEQPEVHLADASEVARLVEEISARWGRDPRARRVGLTNLGRLLTLVGEPERALEVLASVQGRAAAAVRAQSYYVAGEFERAEQAALEALTGEGDEAGQLSLLALIALRRGDRQQALEWLRRALQRSPWHPQSRVLLERLETDGDGADGGGVVHEP